MTGPTPVLAVDLDAGLRRLRLGAMRRLAPELMVTAKTQRWAPEEFLRTLIETEIASRDASNTRARLKAAAFPRPSTSSTSKRRRSRRRPSTTSPASSSSGPERTCAWSDPPAPASPTCSSPSVTPPSTPATESATSPPPSSSRPSTAVSPTTLSRVIETILRADLILIDEIGFAPLDDNGAQLFFRLVAAAYERRSLGIGSHWPFEEWGRFLPERTTAVSLLDRLLHHAVVVATEGESYRMKQASTRGARTTTATT
ncbi:ATP-binding protein [soil metagenome]